MNTNFQSRWVRLGRAARRRPHLAYEILAPRLLELPPQHRIAAVLVACAAASERFRQRVRDIAEGRLVSAQG